MTTRVRVKENIIKKPLFKLNRKTFAYPYIVFMFVFLVVPLAIVLINAFLKNGQLTFANFISFFGNEGDRLTTFGRSLLLGLITTVICLLIGYPVAYILAKHHAGNKVLALFFILPMWVNFLLRTLAIREVFDALIKILVPADITPEKLASLNDNLALIKVLFGLIYNYLPFMILPLHTILSNMDPSYEEAARDLGCDNIDVFVKTTLPLSLPGILSGITMVFIPAISTFAISEILSDSNIFLFGDVIQSLFNDTTTYGVGSVLSLVMLFFVLMSNLLLNRFDKNNNGGSLI